MSFSCAMDIFKLTKNFPKEELYSMTDQIRRASRSITSNIDEGWAKRKYENIFKRHLIDSIGSCMETKLWLDFANECKYINHNEYNSLIKKFDEIGKMLNSLFDNWKTYDK
jgi:four helix bundle protein